MAQEKKKNGNEKTQDWAQTGPVGTSQEPQFKAEPEAKTEPAKAPEAKADAPKKTRKKGQRTPIATRLAAAPTPARKAIIIEGQLQMVAKRKAGILKLVDQSVLDQVDPSLL